MKNDPKRKYVSFKIVLNHPYFHFMSQETLCHRFPTAHQDFSNVFAGGDSYVERQIKITKTVRSPTHSDPQRPNQPYLLVFFPYPIWTPLDNKGGKNPLGRKILKKTVFIRQNFSRRLRRRDPKITSLGGGAKT